MVETQENENLDKSSENKKTGIGLPKQALRIGICLTATIGAVGGMIGAIRNINEDTSDKNDFIVNGPPVTDFIEKVERAQLDWEIVEPTDTELAILELLNAERKKGDLPRLDLDLKLVQLARLRSRHMADFQYFSHADKSGNTYYDDLLTAKCNSLINYSWRAENLIRIPFLTAQDAVEGWMDSPGHKATILSNNFSSIGIGEAKDEHNNTYVTTLFSGKPC